MAYSDKVLDHYQNPRNVGSLDKNDPNVGTGVVGWNGFGTGAALSSNLRIKGLATGRPPAPVLMRKVS